MENLNKEQKKELLSLYFEDEICSKSITDTLTDSELNNFLNKNQEELKPFLEVVKNIK